MPKASSVNPGLMKQGTMAPQMQGNPALMKQGTMAPGSAAPALMKQGTMAPPPPGGLGRGVTMGGP